MNKASFFHKYKYIYVLYNIYTTNCHHEDHWLFCKWINEQTGKMFALITDRFFLFVVLNHCLRRIKYVGGFFVFFWVSVWGRRGLEF